VKAGGASDLNTAFATIVQRQAGALVIAADPFFDSQSEQFAALTVRHAIPTICQLREFAAAGGLISYGINLADAYCLAGNYAGQFSREPNPPTFRCSSRLSLSCSSTSRPQRHWASPFQNSYSLVPTR
jgi:putative ABC transport system substrate-binding protein